MDIVVPVGGFRYVDAVPVAVHTDSCGIYTPMTRGRDDNHAYVVTEENQTAVDVLAQSITRDWIDQPAIARRAEIEVHSQDPPRWRALKPHQRNAADSTPERRGGSHAIRP